MSHTETNPGASDVSQIEKLSFNLSRDQSSREFNCTLRWMIYRIVAENRGITYVQLKKILRGEYGISKSVLDTTISSLTSPTLLNCLAKWRNPTMKEVGAEVGIHLFVHEHESETFAQWRELVIKEFPELNLFAPPVIKGRRGNNAR